TLILSPVDLSRSLTAANVPNNVSVTFSNFTQFNPIGINITGISTTNQVRFQGTEIFNAQTGITPVANLTINSSGDPIALLVGPTGIGVSTTGFLGITSNGSMSISAPVLGNLS